ncbi:hypothetical protein V5J35_004635 [Endozoicomonas sp. NE40]|uniref:DUF2970 domain-containing protein n=1 Tax=Endozoicomonas lisbonensis TaxID=3120522 RepID=A0ABV2SNV0_9GAMM
MQSGCAMRLEKASFEARIAVPAVLVISVALLLVAVLLQVVISY